jgi:dTDP-4-amino-4,6-dideoxygalactose transaminase
MRAGAEPVLADIDPETALMDPDSVERCLSPRTRAVLLVHLYGQMRNMERWTSLCEQAGIYLLEDCAQSHAAAWRGKVAGTFGVWGSYSFYPTKNLGAIGDSGAIVTDSEDIADKAGVLRNYGQSQRYHHPELGLNSRLDELQAAILAARLEWLDIYTKRRKDIAEAYFSRIQNPLVHTMARPLEDGSHVYHLFVVRCGERDRLAAHLQEQEVSSLIHYPIPIHYQKPCMGIKIDSRGLTHAEQHAAQCLSVPCHPQLSDDDIDAVTGAINAFR